MGKIKTMPVGPTPSPIRRSRAQNAPEAKRPHRSEKRKKRSRTVFVLLLLVFVLTAAVILSRTVFFFITDMRVSGNVHYSAQELIDMSAITAGENIFVADKKTAKANILSNMPYVKEAKIRIKLPSTIIIEVIETDPICVIKSSERYYLADEETKILDLADGDVTGLIPVTFTPGDRQAVIGERYIGASDPDGEKFKELYEALDEAGLRPGVTYIDMQDMFDIRFGYNSNLTVKIGTVSELTDKFKMLAAILPKLNEDDEGTLDLSDPAKGYFESGV